MASSTRLQLIEWLKTISVKAEKVIDIGGGNNLAKKYLKEIDYKEYDVLDINSEYNPKYIYDFNKEICCGFLLQVVDKYDVAFCLETLEYFWDPATACENFNKILKPKGKLYLSVGFIYPHHGYDDYLRFTDMGLEKLLEEAMFEDIKITTRNAFNPANALNFFNAEGMHSKELREDYPVKVPLAYCVEATKKEIKKEYK